MKKIYGVLGVLVLLGSCTEEESYLFRERPASETGITFSNTLVETPELNILNYLYYYNGAGVAVADFDGDNLLDIYFGSNQQADALYLNRGDFKFEEVTAKAGIQNDSGWTTGVTHVDINGDGLLDLYICKASGYRALRGRNLLFVNQGPGPDGVPAFKEEAAAYGLDFSGLATQATFLDFDVDGDLDLFLLNHSVHPNRTYGRGSQRTGFDALSGDRLFRNDGGTYTDISESAGIFQGKAGYGLGVGVSDLNADGFPDLYVGNDFFENDYLYMNLGDGSFRDVISGDASPVGHTTHFSMGNDIADINNDGMPDILSLDMLPEDLVTYKTSGLEYGYPIYRQYLQHGYAPQYMQNTLQLNTGDGNFSEIGFLGGLASTEWSWGTLLADFDNDGFKDVFISNGIKGATNDMDYMNFIANEDIQRRIDAGMRDTDMPLTREIPPKKVPDYIFRNTGQLGFEDMGGRWLKEQPSYSHGCAYADLDRDGDLDLIVNRMDQPALVLENTSPAGNHLRIVFSGNPPNAKGIGARVLVYSSGQTAMQENYPTRGYLSAVSPELHFGLGNHTQADSLLVIWPGGAYQRIRGVPSGESVVLRQDEAGGDYYRDRVDPIPFWEEPQNQIPFVHRENTTLDFDREPLIPFAYSHQGPGISVADFNRDGRDDIFIGGAKRQASNLYLQQENGLFEPVGEAVFAEDALSEDTAHIFFDANGDSWPDLLVASGGNEFNTGDPLRPRLYLNREGRPEKVHGAFDGVFLNASDICVTDLEGDGDLDILITADAAPAAFGDTPRHYLMENDGEGRFRDVTAQLIPGLEGLGALSAAAWEDMDGDGQTDLAVAGHWTPVTIFFQRGGRWERQSDTGLERTAGWWNALTPLDIDSDGDMDLVAGNWGNNSKFRATPEEPVRLYRSDFDGNGSVEPLVTYFHNGTETPFASRDELGKQMPFLNKKFRTYKGFAQAGLDDIFGPQALKAAERKEVSELRSMVFVNEGSGRFRPKALPKIAQASAVFDICPDDFNGDGHPDLLLVGNLFQVSTQLGRLDALRGLVLANDGEGGFTWSPRLTLPVNGASRAADTLYVRGRKTYIIARNDDAPALFQKADE